MKNETEKALRRYFREVRSLLIVKSRDTKRFMAEFTSSARDYLEANPGADFEEVRSHFGAPEKIAKSFLDTSQVRYIRRRVRVRNIVVAVLLAALMIWAACVTSLYIEALPGQHGYGIEHGPDDPQRTLHNKNTVIDKEVDVK